MASPHPDRPSAPPAPPPSLGRATDPGPFFPEEGLALPRAHVRCYRPGDGEALAEATNCSYEALRDSMPWARPHQSAAEAEVTVRRFRGRWLLGEDFALGIFDPTSGLLLGSTGYHLRHGPRQTGIAETGMWVRGDRHGQGLGTEVLEGLLRWGFQTWGWRRIVWTCAASNERSRRTAARVGMQLEGVTRRDLRLPSGALDDTMCFGALADEHPLAR
jgi:RimJ/RimL family protein N-acetyltransferase